MIQGPLGDLSVAPQTTVWSFGVLGDHCYHDIEDIIKAQTINLTATVPITNSPIHTF